MSGCAILTQLLAGEEDVTKLADLSRRRLRAKLPQMQIALEGRLTDHHRWMLPVLWDQLEFLEAQLTKVDAQIQIYVHEYQDALVAAQRVDWRRLVVLFW